MSGPEADSGARRQPDDQEVRALRHRLPGSQTLILSLLLVCDPTTEPKAFAFYERNNEFTLKYL